jgi:glycogen(starch) synthase
MHVLITSDTVGGVWTYTQELATGLMRGGHQVTLVSFGKLPRPHQTTWIEALPGLDYRPTEYRLEWMEVAERDIEESRRYLELLVEEVRPDLIHLSQYCYGDIAVDVPRIVVAHSDVVSWWVAVHGCEPDNTPWTRRYREHVINGLRGAQVVIAPSEWMLDQVMKHYFRPQQARVIYNGRTPGLFAPESAKENFVLSVGRVWDAAKQIQLLIQRPQPMPLSIVGWDEEPGKEGREAFVCGRESVELLGSKSQVELQALYSKAAVYAATSRYEPFGLSPLEAALSRCALLMNDNPVFHELWGNSALYFHKDDPDDFARILGQFERDPVLRQEYGTRAYERARRNFTAERMVADYENVYQDVVSPARVA